MLQVVNVRYLFVYLLIFSDVAYFLVLTLFLGSSHSFVILVILILLCWTLWLCCHIKL